jgi:hypothetical protein
MLSFKAIVAIYLAEAAAVLAVATALFINAI